MQVHMQAGHRAGAAHTCPCRLTAVHPPLTLLRWQEVIVLQALQLCLPMCQTLSFQRWPCCFIFNSSLSSFEVQSLRILQQSQLCPVSLFKRV